MDLRETYNLLAKSWQEDHKNDVWQSESMAQFCALLPPGGSVLDVGCGPGLTAKFMSDKGFKVTGIDLSEEMIKLAKDYDSAGEFKQGDLYELDQVSETFDGVLAKAVLLHVPKDKCQQVVSSLGRRLKAGGHVLISVKEIKPGQSDEEIKVEDDVGFTYERFFSFFTQDELRTYVENAGLTVVYEKVSPFNHSRWLGIIGKKS